MKVLLSTGICSDNEPVNSSLDVPGGWFFRLSFSIGSRKRIRHENIAMRLFTRFLLLLPVFAVLAIGCADSEPPTAEKQFPTDKDGNPVLRRAQFGPHPVIPKD
jgi:hypothetical protein